MKKTLSIILTAVLILSALASLAVPAAAAEEGDWKVFLTATSVETPENNPPLPGYFYDDTGFHTISPDYTNYNPKFSVTSKQMVNIKNFTMTVVVHDYCPTNDNWLSFSLWSECNGISQGDTSGKYGDGWTSLIRPNYATGALNRFESWNQTIDKVANVQRFEAIDNTGMIPVEFPSNVDEATGDITVTFAITDGIVSVNGKVIGAGTDQAIATRFPEGLAYVAVTINNTDSTGTYYPTISIADVNGSVPQGSDRAQPESKSREFGELIPADSVPANTPAVWFDGTLNATNDKLPKGSNCDIGFADDNSSINVIATSHTFYMQFEVPDEITYEAADFTYIAIILKNFCACGTETDVNLHDVCVGSESCNLWYFAGNLSSAGGDCVETFSSDRIHLVSPVNEQGTPATEDFYTLVVLPIDHQDWVGRINGFRFDVLGYGNYTLEGRNSFDIMGAGIFRSVSDIVGFVKDFQGLGLNTQFLEVDLDDSCFHFDIDNDGICDYCEAELNSSEDETNTGDVTVDPSGSDDSENTTEAAEQTTEAETKPAQKPAETTAAADDGDDGNKGGCGSMVSMGALAIVAIIGAGAISFKKKD